MQLFAELLSFGSGIQYTCVEFKTYSYGKLYEGYVQIVIGVNLTLTMGKIFISKNINP